MTESSNELPKSSLNTIVNYLLEKKDAHLNIQYNGKYYDDVKLQLSATNFTFNLNTNTNTNANVFIYYKFLKTNNITDTTQFDTQFNKWAGLPVYGQIIFYESTNMFNDLVNYIGVSGLTVIYDSYSSTKKNFCLIAERKLVTNSANKIMFLDTETTGFASSKDPKEVEKFDRARLVELGYLIYQDGKQVGQFSSLVKPDNFIITNDKIHGITQQDAVDNGIPIADVFVQFLNDLESIDTIICHNITFDMNILLAEAYRMTNQKVVDTIESKNKLCTMDLGKKYMKLNKFPKLVDLYKFLYEKEVKQDHRSISDCIICADCYYKMV